MFVFLSASLPLQTRIHAPSWRTARGWRGGVSEEKRHSCAHAACVHELQSQGGNNGWVQLFWFDAEHLACLTSPQVDPRSVGQGHLGRVLHSYRQVSSYLCHYLGVSRQTEPQWAFGVSALMLVFPVLAAVQFRFRNHTSGTLKSPFIEVTVTWSSSAAAENPALPQIWVKSTSVWSASMTFPWNDSHQNTFLKIFFLIKYD